ncbi:MAG: NAD(P)/FAD-dependent oxidoreductase, partial [Deltaproteobacteria bacterium]|nr:NAD(P)/FAD-dependent oxidoreductase [Deltaproteobacteria bacterium]
SIPGLAEARPWTSREATSARAVPRRLLVMGGGAVGAELAQAWRRLGAAEVAVVEAAPGLLPSEEPFAGAEVAEAFGQEGIAVHTGRKVTSVRRAGAGRPVEARLDDGKAIIADELLVAVGRRPAVADLGLESVGVEASHGVAVDDRMRAVGAEQWLFAIGDVNARAPFTHMAKYQARLAADVILGRVGPPEAHSPGLPVPRVTFTDPQVAAVGLTRRRAMEQGLELGVRRVPLEGVAAAAVHGQGTRGTAQLVIEHDRGLIVGATFTGPEVGELLHAATIAIVGGVPLATLARAVPAFPTLSEIWLQLLEAEDEENP